MLNLFLLPVIVLINYNHEVRISKEFTYQNLEVIYSLNEYVTSNIVKRGQEIPWGQTKRTQSSYVLIRRKPEGKTYLQITIGGQFAYGGYFKYVGREGDGYKYLRDDETTKEDYLLSNYPLNVLSESQKYDESIVMVMLNYQTSYGLLFKF